LPRFLEPGLWSPFILHLLAQHSVDLLWQIGSSYVYDLLPSIKQSFPQLAVVDLLFNPVGHTANYLKYNYLIDHVVTEHEGMKQWLIERGEAEETISVIPNGVDLDRYRPEPKRDWRKPEPGGAGAFVVGYMGRLSEEKAPDTFVGLRLAWPAATGSSSWCAGLDRWRTG